MILGGITFRILLSQNPSLVEGFQIHLSDREAENIFHKDKFNLEGVELKTSIKDSGYQLFELKITKEIYLEDNDNFQCKNHANFGDYNSVRTNESSEVSPLILKIPVSFPTLPEAESVPDVLCSSLDD